jgi:predicted RNA methylase
MDYPFANRAAEDERLVAQGALFDPLTRRLLQQAGIASGMRVLDLGSGAGNVARLAAELVGPAGAVVGVERDPVAVDLARRRTDAPTSSTASVMCRRCRTSRTASTRSWAGWS